MVGAGFHRHAKYSPAVPALQGECADPEREFTVFSSIPQVIKIPFGNYPQKQIAECYSVRYNRFGKYRQKLLGEGRENYGKKRRIGEITGI